jgi:type IV pilus assembly protein PilE
MAQGQVLSGFSRESGIVAMRADRHQCASGRRKGGFSLIELMIVLAIIALLVSIAVPTYRQHVIRGKRSGAMAAMMDLSAREQQFLLANRGYANKAALTAVGYSPPPEVTQDYDWDVAVGAGGVPSFLITFTPAGAQAVDGPLTIDNLNNKTPLAKWK